MGYLMPKKKKSSGAIQPIVGGNKGSRSFPKDIRPKMNVIAPLEFEPAYYDVVTPSVSYYAPNYSFK